MKLSTILLKYCIYCWIAILFSRSIAELLENLGLRHTNTPYISEAFCTLAALGIGLIIWNRKCNYVLSSLIDWSYSYKAAANYPKLIKFRTTTKSLLNLSLLIILICLTTSLITHGGRAIALATDLLGNYELGERIYCITASSDGTALASVLGPLRHDTNPVELQSHRLNNMVAKIYGARSKQMASRYYSLGCNCLYVRNYVIAEDYFKKALAIYHSYNDKNKCVWPLASLSYSQYRNGKNGELEDTLNEGLQLAHSCSERKKLVHAYELFMGVSLFSNNNDKTKAFCQVTKTMKIATIGNSVSVFLLHWSGLDHDSLDNYS